MGGIINAPGPLIQAIINAVEFVTNIIGIVIALINGDFSGAWEMAKAALNSFFDFLVNILNAVGAFFQGCWESICAIAAAFGVDLSGFFSGLWENIKTGVTNAWNGISIWMSDNSSGNSSASHSANSETLLSAMRKALT